MNPGERTRYCTVARHGAGCTSKDANRYQYVRTLNESTGIRRSIGGIEEIDEHGQVELNEEPPSSSFPLDAAIACLEDHVNFAIAAHTGVERLKMDDELLRATYQLFAAEREYNWQLTILIEALEILASTKEDSPVDELLAAFLKKTSAICVSSISLISKLEKIIMNWKNTAASESRLGSVFDKTIWTRYDAYHRGFRFIRPFIRLKRRHDRKIASLCSTFERARLNGGRLESLFLLPEERVVAYNEHLDALVRCTSDDHADYATLKGHKDHIEHWMLEERRDEIRAAKNEQKLDEIESQFLVDRLDLLQDAWLNSALRSALAINSASTMNNVKQFVGRRKSIGASVAPPTWFRNSTDNNDNSAAATSASHQKPADGGQHQRALQHYCSSRMHGAWSNGSSSESPNARQQTNRQQQDYFHALKHQQQHSRKAETFVRVYMKEGRVVLTTGVQAQERYLFLFSDLLLVAKENYRGVNSYRLKEKIRLCEVWLCDKGLDEVAETVRNPHLSFIIGWPTKSYVAEFKSVEERNSWYEILVSTISLVKQKERPNTTIVNVRYKDGKTIMNCDIPVNNFETAREMLNVALTNFNTPPSSADEFQLWVQSGRETAAYPLHGHECPFAILLSHIRDLLPDCDGDVDVSLLNDLTVGRQGIRCNFIVKKKRGSKKGKPSKHGAGQFVSHLKRKMKKQDSADSACPPSPTGKLFGVPLDTLTESQPMPKPILALMEHLATEGAFMEGIFRKPPKNSTLRELKEKLDAGCDVDLDGVSPSVSASLLKEFFRQLPDSVLVNEKMNAWISLCDETNADDKLLKAKALASQLPASNTRLLRYFLCVLHIIATRAAYNQMNSSNLGICIAPSLSGASRYGNLNGAAAKRMTELTQYLIDNVTELFGEDTLTLLKASAEQPAGLPGASSPCGGGDDYDAFGHMKQETSSLDSLTATGSSPSSSRPQSSLHQSVNISRDSGLCEAHAQCEDIASGDSVASASVQRCLSHSEDTEDDTPRPPAPGLMAQSVDNLTIVHAQKRSTRIVSDPDASAAHDKEVQARRDNNASSRDESGFHRQQVNIDSTDSVYESAESNASLGDYRHTVPAFRSSKRMPAALLTRSASGDHLYLTERVHVDDEPSLSTALVAQEMRQSRRRRSPTTGDSDTPKQSPLTVSMTAGDSTYGSSPVSPESNDGNVSAGGRLSVESSRSCDTSPSPQPFMTRNSAYRKPARHRKGNAPQPPSPTNVCVDNEEDDTDEASEAKRFSRAVPSADTSNDDEADSGVHVMEVHSARPVVISCNCESSSSVSSEDEVIKSDRKSSITASPPVVETTAPASVYLQPSAPPTSMISEIYPLKSPSQRAWPSGATRFIVDSAPAPAKPDPSVVRRHSSRAYPNAVVGNGDNSVRHSYDEGTLTERVYRGLELMMEKVENAHVGHEKLLRSRLSDSVNDSSTVTETSSEESTPHVSRESSSAQDYKQVARVMFDRSSVDSAKTENAFRYAPPRSYQTLPMSRSVIKSDGSAHLMTPVGRCAVPGPSRLSALNATTGRSSNTGLVTSEERKLCSQDIGDLSSFGRTNLSSLPRYKAILVCTSEQTPLAHSAQTRYCDSGSHVGTTPVPSFKTETKSSASSDSTDRIVPVRVVPVVPGQVRDRVQRYDRERLRRKTLGGLEFSTLAQLARHQTPVTATVAPPAQTAPKTQSGERVTRYDQQRSGATAAAARNRFARTPHSQMGRSTSLDRRTIDLREEERQKSLANAEEEERRRQDISWSVRQYVKMFDSGARNDSAPMTGTISRIRRPSEEKYFGVQPSSTLANRGNAVPYLTRQAPLEIAENRRPVNATRGFATSIPTIGSQTVKPRSIVGTIGSSQLSSNVNRPSSMILQKQNGMSESESWQGKMESGRGPGARTNEKGGNSESYV